MLLESFPVEKFGLYFGFSNVIAGIVCFLTENAIASMQNTELLQIVLGCFSITTFILPAHYFCSKN